MNLLDNLIKDFKEEDIESKIVFFWIYVFYGSLCSPEVKG